MTDQLPFFPFSVPTHSSMIILPQENTEYSTLTMEADQTIEAEKTLEFDIDMNRLTVNKDKQKIAYSIKELKSIAKYLGIKGANTMNKENLVKYIRLKIKK
jgi:phage-related protein